jgi:hypothetical protein
MQPSNKTLLRDLRRSCVTLAGGFFFFFDDGRSIIHHQLVPKPLSKKEPTTAANSIKADLSGVVVKETRALVTNESEIRIDIYDQRKKKKIVRNPMTKPTSIDSNAPKSTYSSLINWTTNPQQRAHSNICLEDSIEGGRDLVDNKWDLCSGKKLSPP